MLVGKETRVQPHGPSHTCVVRQGRMRTVEAHSGSHGYRSDAATAVWSTAATAVRSTATAAVSTATELATTTDPSTAATTTTTTEHATTARTGVATTTASLAATTAATATADMEWTDRVQQRIDGAGNRGRFGKDEEDSESTHFAGDAEFSRQGNRGAV